MKTTCRETQVWGADNMGKTLHFLKKLGEKGVKRDQDALLDWGRHRQERSDVSQTTEYD